MSASSTDPADKVKLCYLPQAISKHSATSNNNNNNDDDDNNIDTLYN